MVQKYIFNKRVHNTALWPVRHFIFSNPKKLIQNPMCIRLTLKVNMGISLCVCVCVFVRLPSSHSLLYQHKTSLNLRHCQFTRNHGLSCLSAHISSVFLYCNGSNALATAPAPSKHSRFQLRCFPSSKYTESVSQKFPTQRRQTRSCRPIPSLGAQERRKKRKKEKKRKWMPLEHFSEKRRHLWLRVNRQLRHA